MGRIPVLWKDGPAQQEAERWAREVCRDAVQLGRAHLPFAQSPWVGPDGPLSLNWTNIGEHWRSSEEIFLRHFTLGEATGPGLPKLQWLTHCFVFLRFCTSELTSTLLSILGFILQGAEHFLHRKSRRGRRVSCTVGPRNVQQEKVCDVHSLINMWVSTVPTRQEQG